MFTIIRNYRRLLLGFIRSEFAESLVSDGDLYSNKNETNIDDLVEKILSDERIDWDDKENLLELKSQLDSDKNEIFDDTKKQTSLIMKNIFNEVLTNWYSIHREEDISSLLTMSKISNNQIWDNILKIWDEVLLENDKIYVNRNKSLIGETTYLLSDWKLEKAESIFNYRLNDNEFDLNSQAASVNIEADKDSKEAISIAIKKYSDLYEEAKILANSLKENIQSSKPKDLKTLSDINNANVDLKVEFEKLNLESRLKEKNEKNAALKNKLYKSNITIEWFKKTIDDLISKVEEKNWKIKWLKKTIYDLMSKVEEKNWKIDWLQNTIDDLMKIVNSETNTIDEKVTKINTVLSEKGIEGVTVKVKKQVNNIDKSKPISTEKSEGNIKKIQDIVNPMKIDWVIIYESNWEVHLKSKYGKNHAYFTINNTENSELIKSKESIQAWVEVKKNEWDSKKLQPKWKPKLKDDAKPKLKTKLQSENGKPIVWEYTDVNWEKVNVTLEKKVNKITITSWIPETIIYELNVGWETYSFDEKPTQEQVKVKIKKLQKEYNIDHKDEIDEKKANDKLGLDKDKIAELKKFWITYEKTNDWIIRLDRKWLWSNDLNIDNNSLTDDKWLLKLDISDKKNILDNIKLSNLYLTMYSEASSKVDSIKNDLKTVYIKDNVSAEDKSLVKYFEAISKPINDSSEMKKVIKTLSEKYKVNNEIRDDIIKENDKLNEDKLINTLSKFPEDKLKSSTWKISKWEYEWKTYDLEFKIDWDELKLDTKYDQPLSDREMKITLDDTKDNFKWVLNKINNMKNTYINDIGNIKKVKKDEYGRSIND